MARLFLPEGTIVEGTPEELDVLLNCIRAANTPVFVDAKKPIDYRTRAKKAAATRAKNKKKKATMVAVASNTIDPPDPLYGQVGHG